MRLSSITEVDPLFHSANSLNTSTSAAQPHPLSPTTCNAKPTAITIYQNGPPPRHSVLIYLKREAIQSWEEAKKLIGENLPNSNGCLRLYRPDGEEVQSLSQLWRAGNILIAAGKDKFDITDFLVGAGGEWNNTYLVYIVLASLGNEANIVFAVVFYLMLLHKTGGVLFTHIMLHGRAYKYM